MIIKVGKALWSDEGTEGVAWAQVADSALSYAQITPEPDAAICAQIERELNAALDADLGQVGTLAELATAMLAPTPRHDAVRLRWGATYRAMRAYADFLTATIESRGQ